VIIGGFFIIYLFKPKKKKRTDSIYTNALNAMVRGDTRIALSHLRDVVKQDSDHINAYLQMGNILRQDNNEQAAIKIHQSLMVRPNLNNEIKLDIHKALALDFEQINDLSRSQQEAELVLKIDKKNQWANEFLLMIFEKQKDWDKATQISKILQRLNKEKDPAQISKFLVFQGMDKLEKGLEIEAIKLFQKAVKTSPKYSLSYLKLGDYYAEKRDLTKAIENWENFALYNPEDSHTVFSKIESALFDLGRFSEVEKFYRRILNNDPVNLAALTRMANVLEEKGEDGAALILVEEAINPGSTDVRSDIMKLKLSLSTSTPVELAHQLDTILEKLSDSDRD
jgi:lipopolysaccharide biosynthesis regulator YciM